MQPLTPRTHRRTRSRRASFALALLLLCLPAFSALADALPQGAILLKTPETSGVLNIARTLPLPDGTLLVGGQVRYPDEYREPYRAGYEDPNDMLRNDAVLMRIEPSGDILWSIRLADPQADNYLSPVGLLPDGRVLLLFRAVDSTFGDRFLIAGLDGVVEGMLPFREIAAHYRPLSLMLMPESGYLGGDSTVVDDYYERNMGYMDDLNSWHTPEYTRMMTLLDFDLSVRWQIDLSPLGEGIGNHNAVEVSDGIVLLGYESVRPEGAESGTWLASTSVLMLDKQTGDIRWQLTDEPRGDGMVGADALAEMPDGSLLVTGAYLEPGQTLQEGEWLATLTKLSKDGEPLWTKRYDQLDIGALYQIIPFEDGFLMRCIRQDAPYYPVFLYIDTDGELLGTLALEPDADGTVIWPHLSPASDGAAYLSGPVRAGYDPESGVSGEITGSFLAKLTAAHFVEASAAAEALP